MGSPGIITLWSGYMTRKIKDPRKNQIEREYFEEVELTDPVTLKKFKQKVKIFRLKPITATLEPDQDDEEDFNNIKPLPKPVILDLDA
jgi:hypothetical protein